MIPALPIYLTFAAIVLFVAALPYMKRFFNRYVFDKVPTRGKNDSYICPRCGSLDWKFPNPLMPANVGINLYQLCNYHFECRKCGYLGPYFISDENFEFENKKTTNVKADEELMLTGIPLVLLGVVVIIALLALDGVFGLIVGLALTLSIANTFKKKVSS